MPSLFLRVVNQNLGNMVKIDIGRKIRFVRQLKGYSQEYMAMRLGISQNAYSKMERGVIRVKNDRLQFITSILEIPAYNLFSIPEPRLLLNDRKAVYNLLKMKKAGKTDAGRD